MELEKLKAFQGIPEADKTKDVVLQFVMEDVKETILNYCNIEELPQGLLNTAYRMAIDLYRYDQPGSEDAPLTVASVSEGDTSTSFTSAADALDGGILRDYRGQLNRYRKLVW